MYGSRCLASCPVLLPALRFDAEMKAHSFVLKGVDPASLLVSHGVVPSHIPVTAFRKTEQSTRPGLVLPMLPVAIDSASSQGSVVQWEGKHFVVLENNDDIHELFIAPAEYILLGVGESELALAFDPGIIFAENAF